MTAVFLFGLQPNINKSAGFFGSDYSPSQRHHVGVIVLCSHLSHEFGDEQRAADPVDLVCGNAYAYSCSAAEYALVCLAGGNILGAFFTVDGVIY